MIAQFVIAVALVAVTCNKALQSLPTIRLARPLRTRRYAFQENESMDFTSKLGANAQLIVSSTVGTPMKSTSTGTIADISSFTLADAGFGSLITMAVIPVIAFLVWQKISKPVDDISSEIRVTGERSLREEEIKTIREKAQKEEGTRSSLIANARADVEKRVAEAKLQEAAKEKQQPVEKESVVQLLEQEFKKEVVVVMKPTVSMVPARTEEEKKMKERADELDAKERAALLAKRKAEADAVKAAKYAAIQKKEQAEAEAAARTRAAAVAAAPKAVPVAASPTPAPAPTGSVKAEVQGDIDVAKEAARLAYINSADDVPDIMEIKDVKNPVVVVPARTEEEKKTKERADELDAKERAALLTKRKAEADATKAAKYAALQKKEQAEAEAAARTRAAAAAAVAAAPKVVPTPTPAPTPVVIPVTPVEAIWEVPEVDTKEAVAQEKEMKLEAEAFARITLEKQKQKDVHDQERRQAADARMQRYKEAEAAKKARYLALQNREKAKEDAARALLQSFTNAPVKAAPVVSSMSTEGKVKDEGDHTWEVPEVDYKEEPAVPKAVSSPSPAPKPVSTSSSTPVFSEKWDDAAIESLESATEESLPLKYGEAAEKPEMKIFDEMQAAAEREGAAMESTGSGVKGALDEAIFLMAKAPLSKLRDLIRKYKPSALPPDESKIGFAGDDMVLSIHLRAGLDATWSASGGSWEKLMTLLREELGQQAEDTTSWMRAAIKAAEDIPEARVKALIKQYGGPEAMPKKRGANKEGKMEKKVYDTTLVDVLRASFGNDYQQVAKMLQEESGKGGQRKGFGGK